MTYNACQQLGDIGRVGYVPPRVRSHRDPPVERAAERYGCGDYREWLKVEANEANKEALKQAEERFIPHDNTLFEPQPEHKQYPWEIEHAKRVEVARELMTFGLRGVRLDRAIDARLRMKQRIEDRRRLSSIITLYERI